jgi:hypothetical protein
MRWRTLLIVAALAAVAGCSGRPVSVSGTVKTKDAKPVTGVLLVLMPDDGAKSKIRSFQLDAQGGFQGEALPGSYTYYLSRMSVETNEDGLPVKKADVPIQKTYEQAYRKVPMRYRTHDGAGPDRKVEVASGATLSLTVAP